jgi:hypothetical protein
VWPHITNIITATSTLTLAQERAIIDPFREYMFESPRQPAPADVFALAVTALLRYGMAEHLPSTGAHTQHHDALGSLQGLRLHIFAVVDLLAVVLGSIKTPLPMRCAMEALQPLRDHADGFATAFPEDAVAAQLRERIRRLIADMEALGDTIAPLRRSPRLNPVVG